MIDGTITVWHVFAFLIQMAILVVWFDLWREAERHAKNLTELDNSKVHTGSPVGDLASESSATSERENETSKAGG